MIEERKLFNKLGNSLPRGRKILKNSPKKGIKLDNKRKVNYFIIHINLYYNFFFFRILTKSITKQLIIYLK